MHPFLNIAFDAVKTARKMIVSSLENLEHVNVREKAKNDFVTEIDKQAEQIIIDTIHEAYPDHAILGEESGKIGESEYTWIIDPIDGTTNFFHGHPHFSTTIAIKYKNKIEHGLTYDHLRQELFTTTRGAGAYLNNKRIRVSKRENLTGALIGVGLAPNKIHQLSKHLKVLEHMLPLIASMRRSGSSALDLAYVAAGRFDAAWLLGTKQWDIAAGALLIKEAGGIISDEDGTDNYLEKDSVVTGNLKTYKELIKIIKQNL